MNVRRAAVLAVDPGVVVSYVHNAAGEGLGKIGVLVAVQSSAPADQLAALGKQLAMHVAAANPLALDEGGIDPEVVRSEEHTSELQSLMRISYAVFCLKKKNHSTSS